MNTYYIFLGTRISFWDGGGITYSFQCNRGDNIHYYTVFSFSSQKPCWLQHSVFPYVA